MDFDYYTIYQNLLKLCGYRNLKVVTALDGKSAFDKAVYAKQCATITAISNDDSSKKKSIIILTVYDAKATQKMGDLRKIFKTALMSTPDIGNIMVVAPNDLVADKKRKKNIADLQKQADDLEKGNVYIELYEYIKFIIEAPRHESVPKHRIMTPEEVVALQISCRLDKEKYPKISINDTQAIWLGLRIGQVCEIERLSETTGTSLVYRLCIP